MTKKPVLIKITVPDTEIAQTIADAIVSQKRAAGVQIHPIKSVYWWDGTIHRRDELVLFARTVSGNFKHIEKIVDTHHPYLVPPMVEIELSNGKKAYLDWMIEHSSGRETKERP